MHIDATKASRIENGPWQNAPVGHDDRDVRIHRAKFARKLCCSNFRRLHHPKASRESELFHGRRGERHPATLRPVGLGDHGRYFTQIEHGFQTWNCELGSTKK